DQPLSEEETIQGAVNRAKQALAAAGSADFGVGIESGISKIGSRYFEGGWVCVVHRHSAEMGLASSNRYEIRPKIQSLLEQGLELSQAIEHLTGLTHVKSTLGMSGVISNGSIDRTASYVDAVVLAFGPFVSNKCLWE
ncbi:hypothetical protein HDU91_004233, partial [Kappamyces sp. JEL0680]